jgi:hypothetical protein
MTNSLNGTTDQNEASWQNEYLKKTLFENVVNVLFVKKDGTERKLICTLKPDLLPVQTDLEEAVQKKTPNPDVLAVWDIENKGWRSFRYDSILGYMVHE